MNRILVIEDNKTLANLIAKKISVELDVEVDVAYNMSEAKLFLKGYKYFLTLSDINLPDAPNGEIVDYVIKTGNHVIILTSNIDKNFRKKMFEKNIIDYIYKSGVEDINYIISNIKRLIKNSKHKVMVVDDSVVFRKQMKDMLENLFFKVVTVAHGEEAINLLESTNDDISLVLTDYNMPVMNGLELTSEIRKNYKKSDLSVIALSGKSDDEEIALFLKSGANDFIKKPFSKEEFSCRINNSIEALENIQEITNQAIRDFLTGLYNRRYFFKEVSKYFNDAIENGESFSIAMVDIDHFKKINDTYGHDTGDKVIVKLADLLRSETSKDDIVARFGGEEFCILLKDISSEKAIDSMERIREKVENSVMFSDKDKEIRYTISIGLATTYENTLDDTVNEADMHLYSAKEGGRNQVVYQ